MTEYAPLPEAYPWAPGCTYLPAMDRELERLTAWLRAGEPACYLRFFDGEFDSILGRRGENCDGHEFFGRTLGRALRSVLSEIADRGPKHGNLLVGGGFIRRHRRWLDRRPRLRDGVPWCHPYAVLAGVETGQARTWLEALRDCGRRKVLVCNERQRDACWCIGAEWVGILDRDCWLDGPSVLRQCREHLAEDPACCLLLAAGMAAEPWGWQLWKDSPACAVVDVGHFFAPAFDLRVRGWQTINRQRVRAYAREITPLVRAAAQGRRWCG